METGWSNKLNLKKSCAIFLQVGELWSSHGNRLVKYTEPGEEKCHIFASWWPKSSHGNRLETQNTRHLVSLILLLIFTVRCWYIGQLKSWPNNDILAAVVLPIVFSLPWIWSIFNLVMVWGVQGKSWTMALKVFQSSQCCLLFLSDVWKVRGAFFLALLARVIAKLPWEERCCPIVVKGGSSDVIQPSPRGRCQDVVAEMSSSRCRRQDVVAKMSSSGCRCQEMSSWYIWTNLKILKLNAVFNYVF